MTFPIVAATVAAALIILQQLLMLSVGVHRTRAQVGVGTGDDPDLERKMRRHGNLAENSALFIIVLALTELAGAPYVVLAAFGSVFVIARLFHAIGMSSLAGSHLADGNKIFLGFRALGAFGTAIPGLALGAYLAYLLSTMG